LTLYGTVNGGELVEVTNASRDGTLRFTIPSARLVATVALKGDSMQRVPMRLDTVIINTDEDRLLLIWRGSTLVQNRVQDIIWTKVQFAPNGPMP
jgi:hypothetical protein